MRRNRETPDGINVEGASYVVIEGFIVNEMPRTGVRGVAGSHLTIRGIRADRNGVWGILIAHCDDAAVIGNETSRSAKEHGIYIGNSGDRPIVRGNIVWGNQSCGIHMNGDVSQGGDGIISGAWSKTTSSSTMAGRAAPASIATVFRILSFAIICFTTTTPAGSRFTESVEQRVPTGNLVVNNTIMMASRCPMGTEYQGGVRTGNTALTTSC